MCRLLGVVANRNAPLVGLLGAELDPFRRLSEVHCDGWGIAYWDEHDNLRSAKAPEAALGSTAFDAAADSAATDAALLHLRKASVGMPNGPQNTHPFQAGSIAFAHNGYIHPTETLDGLLGTAHGPAPIGDTDSERYFDILLAALRDSGPVEALDRTITAITDAAEFISLNCLLLTHDALYAAVRFDAAAVAAKGDDPDTYTLRFWSRPDSVIVASSGWDQAAPDWEDLNDGQLLEIRRHDLRTTVHRLRRSRSAA
ncbi:MAG: class II glutamine amidotransferase [Jatrophihabitans sp.]